MTKAQQTYERVEALVAGGMARADAFKQLAAENGQPLDSIRGAYYTGRKQVTGDTTPTRSRKRETTAHDAIDRAVATLEDAITAIGREVEAAGERAKEAHAEHEAMAAAAGPRIEKIRAKIATLRDGEVADE